MQQKLFIGFDTSCYTTSVACVSNDGIVCDERTVLSVVQGNRGLRQSEALFQHVRNLPELTDAVFRNIAPSDVAAVGVSMTPTAAEDSYMPVFLAGRMAASVCSGTGNVPLFQWNHQAGHVRAALVDHEKLLGLGNFLAVHLSGGTSDMLLVETQNGLIVKITPLGCSNDLHAGQMVDRVGVAMGLSFPAGKYLEELAQKAERKEIKLPSCVRGLSCSFSGAETKLQELIREGADHSETAYAVYDLLARSMEKWIRNAVKETGVRHVLVSGGVASSGLLRQLLLGRFGRDIHVYFGRRELSSDNAVGIALLTMDRYMVENANERE